MKNLLAIIILTMGISNVAEAGKRCSTNVFGEYVCYGTGQDTGYNTRTKRNVFGEDVTTDNRGNRQTCSTNVFGEYVCR